MAGAHGGSATDPVERALQRARSVLPDQGPIGVFVHHNTLHAFQHLPFHEGVRVGAALLGARPYPEEATFRAWMAEGRVTAEDLRQALGEAVGEASLLAGGVSEVHLVERLALEGVDDEDEAGWRFRAARGDLPPGVDRAGFEAAAARLARRPRPLRPRPPAARHRDALLSLTGEDTDVAVHGELIRMCASFLDHGQAAAQMPGRDEGFLRAAARLGGVVGDALRTMPVSSDTSQARAVLDEQLRALGVGDDDAEAWVLAAVMALPGWSGMFARMEHHASERPHGVPVVLLELLAVRACLERHVVATVARAHALPADWNALRARLPATLEARPTVDAVLLAQVAGWSGATPSDLLDWSDAALDEVWATLAAWPSVRRRAAWLEAYEAHYRRTILDALAAHVPTTRRAAAGTRPAAQFVFCIDEREEAMRRALEEADPGFETFGAAGFFGLAVDYRGLDDEEPAPYCPVVATPAHEVHEDVRADAAAAHARREGWRAAVHGLERSLAALSRTMVGGAGLALASGAIAGAVVASRVVAPRGSLAARTAVDEALAPRPATRLAAIREADARGDRGRWLGFTVDEAADRIAALLQNMGLVRGLAPIVVVLGHGSSSLNNPHESAHDCGACGGRRGGANARLFADLANHPEVRAALLARGVHVPADTWFVGGLHDTASDAVSLEDLDLVPEASREALGVARAALERARRESARERCRRFEDAPLGISPEAALSHVEGRASHLAQPRPEYGHCTNAMAFVGRRARTRGLFLDRRPFLVSYDPSGDDDHARLERVLAAVGPVGAGINLEYYFSSIDNTTFGCGTKLPHNVTGLIGVMDGHQGDLRTGLPLQMVEIHEPMRLLLVVEATPEALLAVAGRQAEVRELVVNRWVQLVSMHPDTGALQVFTPRGFEPYLAREVALETHARSVDGYGRHRGHLAPFRVAQRADEVNRA